MLTYPLWLCETCARVHIRVNGDYICNTYRVNDMYRWQRAICGSSGRGDALASERLNPVPPGG